MASYRKRRAHDGAGPQTSPRRFSGCVGRVSNELALGPVKRGVVKLMIRCCGRGFTVSATSNPGVASACFTKDFTVRSRSELGKGHPAAGFANETIESGGCKMS